MPIPQQHGANRPFHSAPSTSGPARRGPYPFHGRSDGSRDGRDRRRDRDGGHFGGPRRNERIRASEVRVIDPDGGQAGVMTATSALLRAREFGLDLVEIAPNARPPVCRIVDFGKYQYEEAKRQKRQKSSAARMKEVKLRPRCDQHDLMIKVRRAENFLFNGHKIKLTLSFRSREMEHPEVGFELVKECLAQLAHVGTPDHPPRLMGRSINTILTPVAQGKRKLIHNKTPQPIPDDDDEDEDDEDLGGDEGEAENAA
ncbi:MAG: translation initiation factor IF-3 [Puniceicoccales bacterium]|jgi:translation initiation factor IF-3|nr:translation initiation factor IF-3 [Puniceicoccales bacterium]